MEKDIAAIAGQMEPPQALAALAAAVKEVIGAVDEAARIDFVRTIVGNAGGDKIASMVDL